MRTQRLGNIHPAPNFTGVRRPRFLMKLNGEQGGGDTATFASGCTSSCSLRWGRPSIRGAIGEGGIAASSAWQGGRVICINDGNEMKPSVFPTLIVPAASSRTPRVAPFFRVLDAFSVGPTLTLAALKLKRAKRCDLLCRSSSAARHAKNESIPSTGSRQLPLASKRSSRID